MAMEEGIPPVPPTDGTPPPAEGDVPSTSGLPSDTPPPANLDGFQLSDEFIAENFKDGKLKGRFESIEDVLTKLKEAEDFKANTIREQKNAEQKPNDAEAQAQAQAKQQEAIAELMPQFIENGMELTDEMLQKAEEVGLDVRDVKLAAMEARERQTKAYDLVGGKENYDNMLASTCRYLFKPLADVFVGKKRLD